VVPDGEVVVAGGAGGIVDEVELQVAPLELPVALHGQSQSLTFPLGHPVVGIMQWRRLGEVKRGRTGKMPIKGKYTY
jgi:hypothetical protein